MMRLLAAALLAVLTGCASGAGFDRIIGGTIGAIEAALEKAGVN